MGEGKMRNFVLGQLVILERLAFKRSFSSVAGSAQCSSEKSEHVTKRRNALFDKEKQRQLNLIPRIDKIEVRYNGIPEDVNLSMNKGISTPFNVAQHLSEMLVDRSALA